MLETTTLFGVILGAFSPHFGLGSTFFSGGINPDVEGFELFGMLFIVLFGSFSASASSSESISLSWFSDICSSL